MKSYFNVDENILNKFFFIFGNTDDCFCDNNFIDMNLKYTLNKHLKDCGYKRIVFYGKDEKIHFYDDESFNLTKKAQEKTETKPAKKTSMKFKGPLKNWMASPPAQSFEKNSTAETAADLHFKNMTEVEAFENIDFCIKDKNIKTAVVITNADDLINSFGKDDNIRDKMLNSFNKYVLDYDNLNIMLLIFPPHTTASEHNENRANVWNTFFKPRFEKNKVTKIYISSPAVEEIRNTINYYRLKYGLQVDFANIETISRKIAREYCKDKLPLKMLKPKLKNIADNRQVLDIERCDEMLGKKDNETAMQKIGKLIGMENIKEEIRMLESRKESDEKPIADINHHSRLLPPILKDDGTYNLHYVITGNPGTGKTTAARLLGEIMYESGYLESGHTVEVDYNDLVSKYNEGDTADKTNNAIERAMGGVLFIDEAYTLAQSKEHNSNNWGGKAIDTILKAMSDRNGQFSVVVAGYSNEMKTFIASNPGLKRRFHKTIHIEDYSSEELLQIFYKNLRNNAMRKKYIVSDKLSAILSSFFENWHKSRDEKWGNAGEVEKLLQEMDGNWTKRKGEKSSEAELILDIDDIPENLQQYCKPSQKTKEDAMAKLKKLTGLSRVKERIAKLQRRIQFEGATEPGHYIFSGNPGTGKTTVAKLLGDILREEGVLRRGHVVNVKQEDLVVGFVRQTAPQTKKKLEEAIDGILFIDEAYSLVGGGQNDFGQEAINTILVFMEDNRSRICVICAGYTKDMERFVQSNRGLKSRFTEIIHFDDYTVEELIEILHSFGKDENFIMEQDFIQKSKEVFELWIKNKSDDFGNARDVRTYFGECKDALYERIDREYEDSSSVPENVKKTLTGQDIPLKYSSITLTAQKGKENNMEKTATELLGEENTFTDRDGKKYKTVKIGNQVWMAENLAYSEDGSTFYRNGEYGRLYDWETAMKACPPGWHLPSNEEWQALVDFVGGENIAGKKLKAKIGWNNNGNGTDNYGFSALPGGYKHTHVADIGNNGSWWSSSTDEDGKAYRWYIYYYNDYTRNNAKNKNCLHSVRYIKDTVKDTGLTTTLTAQKGKESNMEEKTEISNPWQGIRAMAENKDIKEYIADCDKEVINKLSPERRNLLELNYLPQPYMGDPDKAEIFLLNGNPDAKPQEKLKPGIKPHSVFNEEYKDIIFNSLEHKLTDYPLYALNPDYKEYYIYEWWYNHLKRLTDDGASLKTISEKIFVAEYFPYFSSNLNVTYNIPILESQKYTFNLIIEAIEAHKMIVIMRGPWCNKERIKNWEKEFKWYEVVKKLEDYKNKEFTDKKSGEKYSRVSMIKSHNGSNVCITRDNILPKENFDRFLKLLKGETLETI